MAFRESQIADSSKLEGIPNYSVWEFKVRSVLNRDDVWKLVDPPPGTVAPTDPAEIAALEIQKKKALTIIALSVKDNVIPYISHITEPDVCWKVLQDLYSNKTNSRKLLLKRKLTNLKMEEGTIVSQFLQQLKELVNELACVGEILNDAELVERTLMALPESFEGLVNNIMYRETLPSLAALTVILLQEETRRELRGSKKIENEALLVKNGGRGTTHRRSGDEGKKQKKPGSSCHYCGKKDHWLRNCPDLAAELKKRRASRKEPSVNFVDNFSFGSNDLGSCDSDSGGDDVPVSWSQSQGRPVPVDEPELALNVSELLLADHWEKEKDEWFIDSGATRHVTGKKALLSNIREGSSSKISTAGGERLNVAGKGSVDIPTVSGSITYEDVLYVPGVTKNLLSVGTMTDNPENHKLLFDSKKVWILRNFPSPESHHVVTEGKRDPRNGLYKFNSPKFLVNSATLEAKEQEARLWHYRLGHANIQIIQFMAQKHKVTGLPQITPSKLFCASCQLGKQSRQRIPREQVKRRPLSGSTGGSSSVPHPERSSTRTSGPLQLIHSDICDPFSTPSLSGSRYILTITDDFSRFTWLFFLKHKNETLAKFKQFKTMIELHKDLKIKAIRSDRGGEYISNAFQEFCDEHGILRQFTQSHTPHQNGVAERKNRSLMEKARSMAFASQIPTHLWPEAVSTANYLINRTATRANSGDTPYGKLTGITPSLSHLRVFGCRTFVLNTNSHKKKWTQKSRECIFLGYDQNSRGFRNYHRPTRKVIISKDVVFDENTFPCSLHKSGLDCSNGHPQNSPIWFDEPSPTSPSESNLSKPGTSQPAIPQVSSSPTQLSSPSLASQVTSSPTMTPAPVDSTPDPFSVPQTPEHRAESSCQPSVPVHVPPFPNLQSYPISDFQIPLSLDPDNSHLAQVPLHTYQRRSRVLPEPLPVQEETLSRSTRPRKLPSRFADFDLHSAETTSTLPLPESVHTALQHPGWLSAMQDELSSIHKNDTWELVPLPPGRKAISTKWIFRVKTNADGSTSKLKARLVAKGFQQQAGTDYTETFAPVVKWNTLRTVVALAGYHGWPIFHLDVKTAFLNGVIHEDIYVAPPPGFDDFSRPGLACKLKRALYGLKQAPRAWYSKVDGYLLSQGLTKSTADGNLYYFEEGGKLTLLILYVDDVYITGDHSSHIAEVRANIQCEFEMCDLGLLSYSLGLEFIFDTAGILVTQRQYVRELLTEFGLSDCRPAYTPMQEKLKLELDMSAPSTDTTTYQRMVGKLIFLTHTRPDISFAVGLVSRFMCRPQEPHLLAVKQIYRYLKATSEFALLYQRGGVSSLCGFTDSDWAGDTLDRKSTTGFVFLLGGTPITWNSKKQPTVALSSTEAEYMAITEGTKEAIWLRRLLGELKLQNLQTPTMIRGDNQGSINLAHNPIYHGRTKHVEVRHHFIREKILSKEISLEFVPTGQQLADVFTKALGRIAFERIRSKLGFVKINEKKQAESIPWNSQPSD